MKSRVAIGLSGGVDSSVAAALLIDQGYEVTGVYLTCWDGPGCRAEADRKDALDVAMQLKIPFVHLDFQKEYREKVYKYMISEYKAGRTPNPDVMCNKEIKFGLFYEWALSQGYDFVATGHYAQIKDGVKSEVRSQKSNDLSLRTYHLGLYRSADEHKDQTYFLYQLRQEQLVHILFPIGHLTKSEVREEAVKRNLLTAKKPDSQGICFIGEVSVAKFLEERIEKKEGNTILFTSHFDSAILARPNGLAVDATQNALGTIVGKHKGVWFYTVGQKIQLDQRKLAMFDQTNLPHFYVVKKDLEKNVLYVGTKEQLFSNEISLTDIHWIGGKPEQKSLLVRIRHGGELIGVKEIQISNDKFQIMLEKSVWGVASGQAVVLYVDKQCMGGGIIV